MTDPNVLKKAVSFLAKEQQRDGGFLSLSSIYEDDFSDAMKYRSTFPASLVSLCLAGIKYEKSTKKILSKINNFLLSQKSPHWSFNYWARDSKEAKIMPYPDDLDDTFCALSAIWQYSQNTIDGAALARIISLLTLAEEKEGGPYQTWLAPKNAGNAWRDIDLAVNSNVAYFLSLQDVVLDNITNLTGKAIARNNLSSPYYPSHYPVAYFISRWYREKKSTNISRRLLSEINANGSIGDNPLDTALGVSTLLNLGIPPKQLQKCIKYLLKNMKPDGGWEAFAFCIDPDINGKKYYAGSRALSTAFCIEALSKFDAAQTTTQTAKLKIFAKQSAIYKKIISKSQKIFSGADKELRNQLIKVFQKTINEKSGEQIALLPYIFQQSLSVKLQQKIPNDLIVELGVFNIYGWIAYAIYDDFLDDEGDKLSLPAANFCLRELSRIYASLSNKYRISPNIFNNIMNKLDSANAREITNCRANIDKSILTIPAKISDCKDYSKLAEKSLGHAIGPFAILSFLGYGDNSAEMKNLYKFFDRYIIAKQLNDDAHDFEEDLKRGHLTPPVAITISKFGKKTINIKKDFGALQKIFLNKVIIGTCQDILKNSTEARKILTNIKTIKNKTALEAILVPIESSANLALGEQAKTVQFLKNYK